MSIANLIVQPQAAYLITDSGCWDDQANLNGLLRKVAEWSDLRLAISTRGASALLASMVREVEWFRERNAAEMGQVTGGDIVTNLTEIFCAAVALLDDPRPTRQEVACAYFSPEHGRAFGFVIHNEPHEQLQAFELACVRSAFSDGESALGGMDLGALHDPARFNAPAEAAAIADRQRHQEWTAWEQFPPAHWVAGTIRLTTVDADGVRTVPVSHYPDPIGRPVDPTIAALAA